MLQSLVVAKLIFASSVIGAFVGLAFYNGTSPETWDRLLDLFRIIVYGALIPMM